MSPNNSNDKHEYHTTQSQNATISDDERRFHGTFLVCQSVCQQKWSPITLKFFQTIISSGIAGKNQLMYQMIEQKLKSNGLDLQTIESSKVTESDLKEIAFEKHFNEICGNQMNAVRVELSNQKMICFRLIDNLNNEVYFIVNREFHNFFFGGSHYPYKFHENILSNVVKKDYHHLFYSCGAVAMLNLTGQSDVIVQCIESKKCIVPCQVTFRILSLSPKGISCCAIEFQPLVPLHASYLLENNCKHFGNKLNQINNNMNYPTTTLTKRKLNEFNVITDLFDTLSNQQRKTIEKLHNNEFQIPLKIPGFIYEKNNDLIFTSLSTMTSSSSSTMTSSSSTITSSSSTITSSSSTKTSSTITSSSTTNIKELHQPIQSLSNDARKYYQINQKRLLLSLTDLTESDSCDDKHDEIHPMKCNITSSSMNNIKSSNNLKYQTNDTSSLYPHQHSIYSFKSITTTSSPSTTTSSQPQYITTSNPNNNLSHININNTSNPNPNNNKPPRLPYNQFLFLPSFQTSPFNITSTSIDSNSINSLFFPIQQQNPSTHSSTTTSSSISMQSFLL